MNFKKYLIMLGVMSYSLQTQSAEIKHYRELETMNDYNAAMKSYKPQVIKFYTNTCGACKSMEPVFNNVAKKEGNNIDFSVINIESKPFTDLVTKHKIVAAPTTLFVKNGQVLKTEKGSMSEADLAHEVKTFAKN